MAVLSAAYKGGNSLTLFKGDTPIKGGGYVFTDADAEAYVARMTTAPSRDQKAIYDWFVQQAKSIGVWSYITDCGFLCAHDVQAARLGVKNVINPTQVGGSTGHAHVPGQGWSGNGVRYLNTGYAFPAGQQDNASLGIYSLSPSASDNPDMGNETAAIFCRFSSLTKTLTRVNETASRQTDSFSGVGFFLANRLASTAADSALWTFGSKATSTNGAVSSAPVTPSIFIGARNFGTILYSSRLFAYWHIGTGIPEAIIPAYQTLVEQACAMLAACESALPNLTAETRSLYRTLTRYSRKSEYLIGAFDNYNWPLLPVSPETGSTDLIADFATLTSGKVPGIRHFEYRHVTDVGQTEYDAFKARIKAHYAAGGVVWMSHHAGNPVTGSFFQAPTSASEGVTGSMYDLNGDALVNCLEGGSRRTEFLAYVDAMATFFNNLRADTGELIPVVWRAFHEADQAWGWWMGGGTSGASYVQFFRDIVDRLRANGVRNVLMDNNRQITASIPNAAYFPGQTYCDIISADWYEDQSDTSTVGGLTTFFAADGFLSMVNAVDGYFKPRFFPELGARYAAQSKSGYWNTNTGFYHRDRFRNSAGFNVWRSPWGPKAGMTTAADFAAMVADPFCHTLDKVSGVYTATEALAA